MPPTGPTDTKTKDAALAAVTQVIESIAEILLISGVSTVDACQLLRASAVRSAAIALRTETGRPSKSRVAIATGLSRSEVSRLWSEGAESSKSKIKRESRSQQVIDAWFDSPQYLTKSGEPDLIPVFGRRKSLENLVKLHGGGVPVRAMLDELLNIDAVEVDDTQHVRIKSRVAIQKGVRAASLNSFGIRASDLLSTLAHNLTNESPRFEGSTFACDLDAKSLPFIRREIGNRGTIFIKNIDDLLKGAASKSQSTGGRSSRTARRAGVGIFYFESESSERSHKSENISRKYLKRNSRLNRMGKQ